jgi:hypothetical protein
MPALPPITTTICPSNAGSGWMGDAPVAMLMIPPFNIWDCSTTSCFVERLPQLSNLPASQ